MMYAYNEDYLYEGMKNLGGMLDYAVNDCDFVAEQFMQMFLVSGIAEQFGSGNPLYLAGMSGEELALTVFYKSGLRQSFPEAEFRATRSPEYWCGWILAYFQWKTSRSFARIIRECPISDLLGMYSVLHEASEEKCVDVLLERTKANREKTQLQRLRAYAGLTQAALAKRSGVSLRSIQMYEQGRKDINKAQGMTLRRLAAVFGCREEDLLEL